MEAYERIDRIKLHLRENARSYLVGAGCFTAGVVISRRAPIVAQVAKNTGAVIWKPQNTNIAVYALGDPGNLVQCVETGTVYASQNQAARELGVAAARISEHLQGKLPHVKGLHLEVLGKAPVPVA